MDTPRAKHGGECDAVLYVTVVFWQYLTKATSQLVLGKFVQRWREENTSPFKSQNLSVFSVVARGGRRRGHLTIWSKCSSSSRLLAGKRSLHGGGKSALHSGTSPLVHKACLWQCPPSRNEGYAKLVLVYTPGVSYLSGDQGAGSL